MRSQLRHISDVGRTADLLIGQNLYWIFPTDRASWTTPAVEPINHTAEPGPPPPDPSFQPIGHVSVDWEDYDPNEATLCDRANGVCTLASFFILVSQQGKGLGSCVASSSLACSARPDSPKSSRTASS